MPKASVKVMRSFDYCHFEVSLSSDDEMTLDEVNDLRKQAAILADEAVRQYREAKKREDKREGRSWEKERAVERATAIKENPQSEWTIEEAAFMRSYEDKSFWKDYDDAGYYYDDDPERDCHFSMLRRFKESRIKAA
jgi:hypothetical protein